MAAHTPITPSRFCLGVIVWVHCRKKWRKTGADFSSSCMTGSVTGPVLSVFAKVMQSCLNTLLSSLHEGFGQSHWVHAVEWLGLPESALPQFVGPFGQALFQSSCDWELVHMFLVSCIPHGSINLTTQLYHNSHSHKNVKHTMTSGDVEPDSRWSGM